MWDNWGYMAPQMTTFQAKVLTARNTFLIEHSNFSSDLLRKISLLAVHNLFICSKV